MSLNVQLSQLLQQWQIHQRRIRLMHRVVKTRMKKSKSHQRNAPRKSQLASLSQSQLGALARAAGVVLCPMPRWEARLSCWEGVSRCRGVRAVCRENDVTQVDWTRLRDLKQLQPKILQHRNISIYVGWTNKNSGGVEHWTRSYRVSSPHCQQTLVKQVVGSKTIVELRRLSSRVLVHHSSE